MTKDHRWIKFWPQDWLSDANLDEISLESQGFWMRLLCFMHTSERRGYLQMNGKPFTEKQIAKKVRITPKRAAKLLAELRSAGVFSETEQGVIYSRRMVADTEYSARQAANGRLGGSPFIPKSVNQSLNPKTPQSVKRSVKIEAEAEEESEKEKKEKEGPPVVSPPRLSLVEPPPPQAASSKMRRSRMPANFWPNETGCEHAARAGIADIAAVVSQFSDFHTGRGTLMADWQAAWRTWCANHRRYAVRSPQSSKPRNGWVVSIEDDLASGLEIIEPEAAAWLAK